MSEGFDSDLPGGQEATARAGRMVTDFITPEERAFVYVALHVYSLAGLSLAEACQRTASGYEGADTGDRKSARKLAAVRKFGAACGQDNEGAFLYDLFEKAGFALGGQERALMAITLSELSAPGIAAVVFGALSKREVWAARP